MAVDKGWYEQERTPLELLCLIHSEISEACEALRQPKKWDVDPVFTETEIELADAMIRILDMAMYMRFNIGFAIVRKLEYNAARPKRHGGKAY